jgi:hypothetical protein
VPLKFDRVMIKKPGEYFSKHGGHGERDTFPLEIKAAMKNMATSQYFRFTLPVVVPAVGAPGNIVDAKVTFCARGYGGGTRRALFEQALVVPSCVCVQVFFPLWHEVEARLVVTGVVKVLFPSPALPSCYHIATPSNP